MVDSPTATMFSRAWCVGLFPDNWEGSIRVGDCNRPAIWKVNCHILTYLLSREKTRSTGQTGQSSLGDRREAKRMPGYPQLSWLRRVWLAALGQRLTRLSQMNVQTCVNITPLWSFLHVRKGHAPGIAQTVVVDRAEEALQKDFGKCEAIEFSVLMKKNALKKSYIANDSHGKVSSVVLLKLFFQVPRMQGLWLLEIRYNHIKLLSVGVSFQVQATGSSKNHQTSIMNDTSQDIWFVRTSGCPWRFCPRSFDIIETA